MLHVISGMFLTGLGAWGGVGEVIVVLIGGVLGVLEFWELTSFFFISSMREFTSFAMMYIDVPSFL